MGKDYIAFIAGLPEITINDRKLSLSVHDLREQAETYITGKDKTYFDMLFLDNDNRQVLRMLNKHTPDQNIETVFPLNVLEDQVQEPENILPEYLDSFIREFKDGHHEYAGKPENVLSERYYDYMIHSGNLFLENYATFILNLKNLITAINSRKHEKDIAHEVVGDNEFAQQLKQTHAKDFGLSVEYPWVEKVLSLMENNDLVERERGLDLLIWDYLDEAVVFNYFSIERVIGFTIQLMIVERWSSMNSESGRKIFMELVDKFRKGLMFDKQFE